MHQFMCSRASQYCVYMWYMHTWLEPVLISYMTALVKEPGWDIISSSSRYWLSCTTPAFRVIEARPAVRNTATSCGPSRLSPSSYTIGVCACVCACATSVGSLSFHRLLVLSAVPMIRCMCMRMCRCVYKVAVSNACWKVSARYVYCAGISVHPVHKYTQHTQHSSHRGRAKDKYVHTYTCNVPRKKAIMCDCGRKDTPPYCSLISCVRRFRFKIYTSRSCKSCPWPLSPVFAVGLGAGSCFDEGLHTCRSGRVFVCFAVCSSPCLCLSVFPSHAPVEGCVMPASLLSRPFLSLASYCMSVLQCGAGQTRRMYCTCSMVK